MAPMEFEEAIEPIILTAPTNTTINKQNCYKHGRHVHIYVRYNITGNITSATTYDFATSLPLPKSVTNSDNGFGFSAYYNGTTTSIGNGYVDSSGKMHQGIASNLSSGQNMTFYIDYYTA